MKRTIHTEDRRHQHQMEYLEELVEKKLASSIQAVDDKLKELDAQPDHLTYLYKEIAQCKKELKRHSANISLFKDAIALLSEEVKKQNKEEKSQCSLQLLDNQCTATPPEVEITTSLDLHEEHEEGLLAWGFGEVRYSQDSGYAILSHIRDGANRLVLVKNYNHGDTYDTVMDTNNVILSIALSKDSFSNIRVVINTKAQQINPRMLGEDALLSLTVKRQEIQISHPVFASEAKLLLVNSNHPHGILVAQDTKHHNLVGNPGDTLIFEPWEIQAIGGQSLPTPSSSATSGDSR